MPAKSEAQRRYIYATKGKAWAERHGFDNKGKLPAKAGKKKGKKAKPKKGRAKKKTAAGKRTKSRTRKSRSAY